MCILPIILGLLSLVVVPLEIQSAFTFDNVRCIVQNKNVVDIDYCYLKSFNRTYKYVSIKTTKFPVPITTAIVTLSILKRENRSVLYNLHVKFDGCRYMRDRDNVMVDWFLGNISPYTNLNHTCPYEHAIELEKLPVGFLTQYLRYVIPAGRYYFNSSWILNGKQAAQVFIYFSIA